MVAALRVVLAATWLLSGVVASSAQGYPSKPVRVVVGFPAGGPTDAIARIVAQKLTDNLGHQFFVENIGGAGGNTAAGQVARVTPDGYTIMVISTGFVVNPSLYAKVPYDPVKDFAPVTLVAVSPNVVVVNPQVAAKTLPELVQLFGTIPASTALPVPASDRHRIWAASFSGWPSISTWCTCLSQVLGRRSRQRSAGTRRSPSPRCRLPYRRCRADNCARWAWRQPNVPPGCPTCRPSPNRA